MTISNHSKLLASKILNHRDWTYINPDLYELFDRENNAYLEAEVIEGELFFYEPINLMSEKLYCLNKKELR